jgi:hypothetical protein
MVARPRDQYNVSMEKEGTHRTAVELVARLERHIEALGKLPGHEQEIDSCKKAIENLKEVDSVICYE